MMHFLTWLEQTGLSRWVSESPSLFAYPSILFLHTAGLAFLVGPSIAISARILGFPTGLPLWPMEKFYPVMWWGFWINLASGVVLLVADATTKLTNWDFYVKLAFIGIAVIALIMIRKRVFSHPSIKDEAFVPANAKALAVVLLVCWTGAITAGRLMAYLGPVAGGLGLKNKF